MEPTTSDHSLTVTDEALQFLSTSRAWALFLAIMGFIGAGFMVLMGLVMGVLGSTFGAGSEDAHPIVGLLLGLLYVAFGALYAFPAFFLLRFSTYMKEAIATRADERLTESFRHLRSYFTFTGIALIVVLSLVGLGIIVAIFVALVSALPAHVIGLDDYIVQACARAGVTAAG